MKKIKSGFAAFFGRIGSFFGEIGNAFIKGDAFVKLSVLWLGAGYFRRKQYIKGVIMTLVEVFAVFFTFKFALQYVPKFGTLGTVVRETVFDVSSMSYIENDYDNSFSILLFSVFSFVVWAVLLYIWLKNIVHVYELQVRAEKGQHINNFKEDLVSYINEKFHISLLTLPVLGVVVFTIIPLIVLIFVAFTNYDQNHLPPSALFSWVGLENFKNLFGGGGLSSTFGYAFIRVLAWTFIWAIFSTLTTYFGGILLALLIQGKNTKGKKLWRLLFMISIAVPQFVSLLLIRNFFANNGIMNTLCAAIGLTDWLREIGVISTSYIPFLSAPIWAHITIIVINIWIGVPYSMLVTTGVLMNIPQDQIESAKIDGASAWQIFIHITFPYVFYVTGPSLVTDFVKNINNFNVIYLLTSGVYTTTNQALAASSASEVDLLVTWLFSLTQDNYNYKMASVLGVVIFVICAAFTLICFRQFLKENREGVYS